ncbi:MAG: cell envelope integrity protein CreD [Bacteroidota bacterium]
METNQTEKQKVDDQNGIKSFFNSHLGHFVVSIFVITFLMIPTAQVGSLIAERQNRQSEVTEALSREWGPALKLNGLVLEVPMFGKEKGPLYIYPEKSSEEINAQVNERYRGIFKANIFSAKLKSTSSFQLQKIKKNSAVQLDWSRARILLITGKGARFTELANIKVNGQVVEIAGQTGRHGLTSYTNSFMIDSTAMSLTAQYAAELNGTERIIYEPTAAQSKLNLTSNWMDPAFSGTMLPLNGSFKKEGNHIKASWKNLTHIGTGSKTSENVIEHGNQAYSSIEFITILDQYQLNERTIKYAILVLTLTFAVFFLVQIVGKKMIHPIHYLMIGLALLLFYSLLLSLSEHLGFNGAYIVSALAIISLIFWYAKSILNSTKFAVMCALGLLKLYAFLLVLVNLEVYALLVGSIGLLLVLAAIMSVTRKIKID